METSKEVYVSLKRVLYIHYPLCIWKDTTGIKDLINSGSEVIAIILAYASKLGLNVHHTNVRT